MSETIKTGGENPAEQPEETAEQEIDTTPQTTGAEQDKKSWESINLDELQPGEKIEVEVDIATDSEEAIREETDRMVTELLRANGGSLMGRDDTMEIPSTENMREKLIAVAEANKAEEAANQELSHKTKERFGEKALETVHHEALSRKTFERVRANKAFKKLISSVVATVIVAILAMKTLAGAVEVAPGETIMNANMANSIISGQGDSEENISPTASETDSQHDALTGYEELDSRIDYSLKQYDNPGCCDFEPEKKYSTGAVGNFEPVFELMGVDPAKATAEDYGKAYQYMTYSMGPVAAYTLSVNNANGFEGMSLRDAEDKIASTSSSGKMEYFEEIKDISDRTTYYFEEADGIYKDHGIYGEGEDKHGIFENVDLSGEKLVRGETLREDGSKLITYFLARCGNMVNFVLEQTPDGQYHPKEVIVERKTNPTETTDSTEPTEPDTQPSTQPGTEPSTEPSLDKKNQKAEVDNASSRATQLQQTAPQTSLKQDQQNFKSVANQQATEADRQKANQRAAIEQAYNEIKAEETAKQREYASGGDTAAADAAAAKARAEAEEAQRKAAEAERAREAQRQAAAQAQAEADAKAKSEQQYAQSVSDNNESRDAADFANGEFELNN